MSDDKVTKRDSLQRSLSDLELLITQVRTIDFSAETSEQATREILVNPVIAALGWNTFNPDEVAREYSVVGGRVDYCLRTSNRVFALIEVKRVGTDLREHQEQLLRYAFNAGVPIAALTDGLLWWLYLPMADTSWEQRRFSSIDLREKDGGDAVSSIHRYLSRHGLVSGASQEEAQQEFESQERDRRLRAALNEAWQCVVSDPQGLLRDLLAETVQEISGDSPNHGMISEFLEGVSGGGGTESESAPRPRTNVRRRPADSERVRPSSKNRVADAGRPRSGRKQPFRFSMVGIGVGTTLTSVWDDETRCTVLSDKKVQFKNKEMSLSAAALRVVHDMGRNWKAVSGPESWRFGGETLAALRERLFPEG